MCRIWIDCYEYLINWLSYATHRLTVIVNQLIVICSYLIDFHVQLIDWLSGAVNWSIVIFQPDSAPAAGAAHLQPAGEHGQPGQRRRLRRPRQRRLRHDGSSATVQRRKQQQWLSAGRRSSATAHRTHGQLRWGRCGEKNSGKLMKMIIRAQANIVFTLGFRFRGQRQFFHHFLCNDISLLLFFVSC